MLRFAVFIVAGFAAVFWLYVAGADVGEAIESAKGDNRAAVWATLVFLTLVLPALVLATCNWHVAIAAILAGIAFVLYPVAFWAFVPRLSGTVQALLGVFIVLLAGCYALWRSGPTEPAKPATWESVRLRIAVLYAAGVGTVLWLASFIPAIEGSRNPAATGFHIIPVFYGTIFFLAVVVPLLVIGIRGSERRSIASQLLVVAVVIVFLIFGLPLFAPLFSGA